MEIEILLEAGRKYSICSCGKSKTLPFCDDSHREYNETNGTNYKSVKLIPEKDVKIKASSANWREEL